MTILAIDPSLTATGYAVLIDNGTDAGDLREGGIITARDTDADLWDRSASIAGDVGTMIASVILEHGLTTIVLEMPQTGGSSVRHSATSPAAYGFLTGMVASKVQERVERHGLDLLDPSATSWTRGLPPVKGDPYKTARVAVARRLWPDRDFGVKSKAHNVADAALLARWAMKKVREGI